ncbi:D-glucuronyl C5-epimerase family protein [Novipirellula caenicola]
MNNSDAMVQSEIAYLFGRIAQHEERDRGYWLDRMRRAGRAFDLFVSEGGLMYYEGDNEENWYVAAGPFERRPRFALNVMLLSLEFMHCIARFLDSDASHVTNWQRRIDRGIRLLGRTQYNRVTLDDFHIANHFGPGKHWSYYGFHWSDDAGDYLRSGPAWENYHRIHARTLRTLKSYDSRGTLATYYDSWKWALTDTFVEDGGTYVNREQSDAQERRSQAD